VTELWRPVSADDVKRWRSNLPAGWRRETSTIRSNAPTAHAVDGDTAFLEPPAQPKPMEGRAAVDAVARDLLEWVKAGKDSEAVKAKVRQVKAAGGLQHLSDDEAAQQLVDLAVKMARESVERVYAREGRNRPVSIDGVA
jgi:hypothetical protein